MVDMLDTHNYFKRVENDDNLFAPNNSGVEEVNESDGDMY